jgi:hypothetical protein
MVRNGPSLRTQLLPTKPLNTTPFNGQKWAFQQGSAPADKAKTTQEWLGKHVSAFISAEDWPLGSPDLNPLDY